MNIEALSREELELTKEGCCEGCAGNIYFWDSDCRFNCDGFATEAAEVVEELRIEKG